MPARTAASTADDVLGLPVPPGITGYEFVDGEPVPVTPASFVHARLVVEITARLHRHVKENGLSGTVLTDAGFVLGLEYDPERMRGPDVAYVRQEKVDAHHDPERLLRCVPDLAVEVDLTSARKPGGQQRIVDYIEAGTPLVWSIDPRSGTAIAYRPDGSAHLIRAPEALDGEEVVPGFRLLLAELFG